MLWTNGLAHTPFSVQNTAFDIWNENASPPSGLDLSGGKQAVLTLAVDSIHNVNCLRPTGYLSVVASGGIPPYNYNWSNGNTGSVASSLAPGTYSITVIDDDGAIDIVSATITQDFTTPTAEAGVNFTTLCSNSAVSLNGAGSTGAEFAYLWTASGGGSIQSGANTLTPLINHVGVFTLKVTNTNNGCTATDGVAVTSVHQSPAATASGGTFNCTQPSLTLNATYSPANTIFIWNGPGGYTSNLLQPTVGVPGSYIFTVTDTLTTCFSSPAALVVADTSKPTALAGGGDIITCAQTSVTLTGTGLPAGVTFAWTGPNGFTSALQNPVVSAAGTYQLIVTKPQNGCTAASSISVTANTAPPTASASVAGALTCVVNSLQIFGTGTPAGTTFAWTGPNGFNSSAQNPTVFGPGIYVLTVTNPQNGCTANASATVISNTTPPGATATGGLKTCANPTVTLNATSGTSGVSYLWSGSGGFMSNLPNPTVSLIGTYSVTVTNPVNGCVSSATASVTQNLTPPNVTATSTSIITCANPTPQITASSQTTGATFSWTGPNGFTANIPNPHVSVSGIYTVTATNPLNGCTSFLNVFVNQNTTPPFVYAGEDRALNCNFTSILANPIGTSTGNNFTYLWTTLDGNIASGENILYARFDATGTYTLTVQNTQNGCTASDNMEVTQSPPVTVSASQLASVNCFGGTTGTVKATPGGGSGSYSYAWSNGSQTATVTGLGAGTYTITATDAEGCTATASVTLTQPPALQAAVSATPQTTYGVNNGTATVAPSGGTPPYSVQWSSGAMVLSIGALAPGPYTVTVTDNKGCTVSNTAVVSAVNCAVVGTIAVTNITCAGSSNGTATANITGGTNPTTYIWSNGANTKIVSGLAPGNYSVTATDVYGCSVVLSTQITAPQPIALTLVSKTDVPCANSQTGTVTMNTTGGTAPLTYTWSNGSTGATISGLGAGSFTCTVTDANGCTKNLSAQIVATDNTPPQLLLKNATAALNANGTVTVTANMFDNGSFDTDCGIASLTVSPTTFDCEQIGTRTVTLTATDNNGNTTSGTATVTVTDNIAPTLTCPQNQTAAACASTVTYNLPQVSDNCSTNTSLMLVSGLPSGAAFPVGTTQQQFSYTDVGGNQATCSFQITVMGGISVQTSTLPSSCSGTCDGSAVLNITGGNNPASINWSNGQSGLTATGLCPGDYTATLTDAMGCSQIQTVQIEVADNEAPTLTCPSNVVAGYCNPAVTFAPPQVLDNCAVIPQQIELIAGLPSGSNFPAGSTTQTYRYTDAGGNAGQCSFSITVHPEPVVTSNFSNISCANLCDGTATIVINGGQGPFAVLWSNGQSGLIASNLCTGTFTATITDADGCPQTRDFQITQPPALNLTINQVNNNTGSTGTGSIAITVGGGTAPYSYSWALNGQPFAMTEDLANLFAGQYAVVVTDANGCTVASASLNVGGLVTANEPENVFQWALFPNPATAEVFLEINESHPTNVRLGIFDAAGRLLREQQISPLGSGVVRIGLDDLPNGLLLFRLADERGASVKRLIKSEK